LLLFGCLAGCKRDEGREPNVNAIADANYGDVPPRQVITDIPDGFFERDAPDAASTNVGATPISPTDAGPRADMLPPTTGDAAGEVGPDGSCSLVQQNCGGQRGCYPAGSGGGAGRCLPEGGFQEYMICQEHSECVRGHLCGEAFGAQQCLRICDTAALGCPAGRVCRAYPGTTIGTCSP
jgi:hypothetical protein